MIGRRITPTELPQTVAALHSVVGLAAVLTSIGSVMADIADISTLHMVTAYLGVLIGKYWTLVRVRPSAHKLNRWSDLHWLHRCLFETCRPHVFESEDPSWSPPDQYFPSWRQCRDNGSFPHHGPRVPAYRRFMPGGKYGLEFHEGIHHDCGNWRSRHAYVVTSVHLVSKNRIIDELQLW